MKHAVAVCANQGRLVALPPGPTNLRAGCPERGYCGNVADVSGEVRRLVCERLGVAGDRVKPEASFIGDLGADSLAVVELTLVFEETFDIEIPDEEAERIRTVRDAIISVEKHLRAQLPG
jgi:acyl carrier protein